jgi:hypothetical protein
MVGGNTAFKREGKKDKRNSVILTEVVYNILEIATTVD